MIEQMGIGSQDILYQVWVNKPKLIDNEGKFLRRDYPLYCIAENKEEAEKIINIGYNHVIITQTLELCKISKIRCGVCGHPLRRVLLVCSNGKCSESGVYE